MFLNRLRNEFSGFHKTLQCRFSKMMFFMLSLLLLFNLLYFFPIEKTSIGQVQNILVSKFRNYEDKLYGFKIEYPADWEKVQFSQGITIGPHNMIVNFVSPSQGPSETFRKYLLIEVTNLTSANSNLSTFSKEELSFLAKSLPHFTTLQINSNSSLAGNNAEVVVFTYSDPIVGTAKAMEIWAVNGSKGYIISYHADSGGYAIYLPTIETMINSFKIIPK
jgi:hypothetical protein